MARRNRSAAQTPGSRGSRYESVGSDVVLPRNKLAGKSRAKRPGSEQDRGQQIRNEFRQYIPGGIESIRSRSDITEIIKTLMREEGIFSSSGNAMVSIAANSGWKIAGYDMSGTMSTEVMSLGYVLMDRLDTLSDYSAGYNDKPAGGSLRTMLTLDVVTSGGCGAELVLAKDFSPERMVAIPYSGIDWESDGQGGRYPTQDSGDIELNIPTVFVAEHNRQPSDAYSSSILRPGLNNTLHFNEFIEDTRRAVNRVGHSRMTASIVAEKLQASAPQDVKNDDRKMQRYMEEQYEAVVSALESLEPEDAVVAFDSVEFEIQDMGGAKSDYTPLLSTLGNLLGASLKTPSSVTGLRAQGGQGLSNAETLVYLQTVDAIRRPVEEVLSRALTLAVRLLGVDGFIKFEFEPINLRPADELEAYRGTKQKRVLEALSWGLINDAQACFDLGIRPQGLQEMLAGTRFYSGKTETGEGERESSTGRSLNPGTPSQSGGDDQE